MLISNYGFKALDNGFTINERKKKKKQEEKKEDKMMDLILEGI